jgi:predicted DNA-binding transcriptional regulator AlpA
MEHLQKKEAKSMTVALEDKVLWSIKETVTRLGISKRTLYECTSSRGTLKRIKIGTRTMYRPETVLAWLAERERNDAGEDE